MLSLGNLELGKRQHRSFIHTVHIHVHTHIHTATYLSFRGGFCLDSAKEDNIRPVLDDLKSSVSDYFPMIRRGYVGEEKEGDAPEVVTSGWQHDIASRREREEGLR